MQAKISITSITRHNDVIRHTILEKIPASNPQRQKLLLDSYFVDQLLDLGRKKRLRKKAKEQALDWVNAIREKLLTYKWITESESWQLGTPHRRSCRCRKCFPIH